MYALLALVFVIIIASADGVENNAKRELDSRPGDDIRFHCPLSKFLNRVC